MNLRVISTTAQAVQTAPVLTASEAVGIAKNLAPKFAMRAAHAEKIRRVPEESIEELNASGLLRLMQPKRFGGSELGLGSLMDVVLEICKGCSSTAWAYSNLASHAWNIGQFELQAQEDVWGTDPFALAATGFAFPCGKAVPVEGGYKVSGKWPFGSGVDASTWMLVGAMTEQNGGAPQRRFFLIPQADFKSQDNWQAYGLGGTGSHDVHATDAFVPEHRSVSAEIFAAGQNLPGAKLYKNKLFQMPTFAALLMFWPSCLLAQPKLPSNNLQTPCAIGLVPTRARALPNWPLFKRALPKPRPVSSLPKQSSGEIGQNWKPRLRTTSFPAWKPNCAGNAMPHLPPACLFAALMRSCQQQALQVFHCTRRFKDNSETSTPPHLTLGSHGMCMRQPTDKVP